LRHEQFSDLIFGRTLAEDAVDEKGHVIAPAETLITKEVRDTLT
jgi:hypothetical protein